MRNGIGSGFRALVVVVAAILLPALAGFAQPDQAAGGASDTAAAELVDAGTERPEIQANDVGFFCTQHKCVALLIAVESYTAESTHRLINGIQSSSILAASLKDQGIEVDAINDPSLSAMEDAVEKFHARSKEADLALIYFNGISLTAGGRTYLMAADAKPLPPAAPSSPLDSKAISNSLPETTDSYDPSQWTGIVSWLDIIRANEATKSRILIFDTDTTSVSDIELVDTGGGSLFKGLVPPLAPEDRGLVETIVVTSGSPGQRTKDTVEFAQTVATELRKPGDLVRVFGRVSDELAISTYLGQVPAITIRNLRGRPLCLSECAQEQLATLSATEQREALEAGTCDEKLEPGSSVHNRYALVIGNNNYTAGSWARLSEPSNDADTIGKALSSAGFRVRRCLNLPLDKLNAETEAFVAFMGDESARWKKNPDDHKPAAFIYFSGHGAADAKTQVNYLIPTDSEAEKSDQLRKEALPVDDVIDGFTKIDATLIFVIDACRNALAESVNKGDDDKGIVPFRRRPNVLIASATQPGEVASQSSGYSRYLAEAIEKRPAPPNLPDDVGLIFRDVGNKVEDDTKGQQKPVVEDGLRGRFYFQVQDD
ncbi:MAG TPA: caspase family protein [Hyphomonas sp.]|nr:caspase family protein [Hyphomonas sp.]HPE46854.1 caspase family protein [Hyphomonas sp.]